MKVTGGTGVSRFFLQSMLSKFTTHTIMMKGTAKLQGGQWIGGIIQYFTVGDLNRVK